MEFLYKGLSSTPCLLSVSHALSPPVLVWHDGGIFKEMFFLCSLDVDELLCLSLLACHSLNTAYSKINRS